MREADDPGGGGEWTMDSYGRRRCAPDLAPGPTVLFRWMDAAKAVQYELDTVAQMTVMTAGQAQIADLLARQTVGIPLVNIADALGMSPPAVTQAIRRMHRTLLVALDEHPMDGRCHSVFLTSRGRREWATLRSRLLRLERHMLIRVDSHNNPGFEATLLALREIDGRRRFLRPEPEGFG